MKLNKNKVFTYVFLMIVVFLIRYDFSKLKEYETPSKIIQTLDESVFDLYDKQYDENRSFSKYWGFSEELDEDKNDTNTNKLVELEVVQPEGKNVLCIASSCYRLLGIHFTNKIPSITMYNINLKEKVKSYAQKDILESNISINTINLNTVEITELNTNRKWHFKLFDVNQSKYEPKEIEE